MIRTEVIHTSLLYFNLKIHSPSLYYCNSYQKFSNICKPEEGWYGLPKMFFKKAIQVVISFAVVFGLLVFCSD